jgi:hypothetical protein
MAAASPEELAQAICLAQDHPERLKPWRAGRLTSWRDSDSGAIVVVYDPKGRRAREMARAYRRRENVNAGA